MKNKNINNSSENIRRFKNIFIIVYIMIIVVSITVTSAFAFNKTDQVIKSQVTMIASSLNKQMQTSFQSHLSKVETIGTLIFTDEYIYKYDATLPSNDEYESIKIEESINEHLYNISILENMTDFGIIYRNNHFVGKISNGTINNFGEELYDGFESMITSPATLDGWRAGYNGNYKRFYYVKKVNENALLAISFYTSELDDVFVHSSLLDSMKVHIVNAHNNIIYSHNLDELGTPLSETITSKITGYTSGTYIDNEYLIAVNECENNWRIILTVPTSVILSDKSRVQNNIIVIGIVAIFFAVLITIYLLERIITPVSTMVTTLDDKAHTDLLTGILNKRSFEDYSKQSLKSCSETDERALIVLDIDNFKGVNDTLGHAYGDKVLTGVGDILKRVFKKDDLLGRVGGDEFCILLSQSEYAADNYGNYRAFVESKCKELCRAFNENYTGDDNNYKISASIGAAVFPHNGKAFEELYHCADIALYNSKHNGKDTYTIFTPEMEETK